MPGILIQDAPFKTLRVKELHPTFGAEIEGVDFDNVSDETLGEIISAMAKVRYALFVSRFSPGCILLPFLLCGIVLRCLWKILLMGVVRRVRFPQH